ncbi:MAG: radical SAM protein [Acidobacteria bacterium]|nr:MAG: radical SAM protein [Acidobacteriota bacterium]
MKVALINPPIYDFAAYDFWLRPYGLLQVGGSFCGRAELFLFDYLDRHDPAWPQRRSDRWGRGKFRSEVVPKPPAFSRIRRKYKRYGLPRSAFLDFLDKHGPLDLALIQTGMTYWYLGVKEVLDDLKQFAPRCRTVLGGSYATLCETHAWSLGPDLVISRDQLAPLWDLAGIRPPDDSLPFWTGYPRLDTGALKLTDGCPFSCTYCSVPMVGPEFKPRPLERCWRELSLLLECGARNIVLYDDALLFCPHAVLVPLLERVIDRGLDLAFHTPNAMNARFVTAELAGLMVRAGFKSFYLGLESDSTVWHSESGRKVYAEEFQAAVGRLIDAGAAPEEVCAYILLGHPRSGGQEVESSLRFAHSLGVRSMLAEFSPIPGTPDGELCRQLVDLNEPLWHNNTLFPIVLLGERTVLRLKDLCRELNAS